MNQPRFPILTPDQMSDEQKVVAAAIAGGPRGGIRGPFLALIHHPELANLVQGLGEHLRYGASVPAAMIELVVLIIARHWTCQYEWLAHERIARSTTDLPDALIKAIQTGHVPPDMTEEQATVYAFVKETIGNGQPDDATYHQAAQRFGRPGVLDLIALCGYYSMLAMVLNTSQIPLPDGAVPPLQPLTK